MKPLLIIPIEVKAREFPSRLFFTACALRRGYRVLLGRSKVLHQHLWRFPRGVLVENDINPRSRRFLTLARQLGFDAIAWDEESLVTLTDEMYAQLRIHPDNLRYVRAFFCRGPGDRDAIARHYPDLADKLHIGGNPRMDILRPEYYPRGSKSDGNRMILVNSRFASANPFRASPEQRRKNYKSKFGVGPNGEFEACIDGWFDHAAIALKRFHAMVGQMAERFPDARIVVRPHPAEGTALWQSLADQHPNVTCDRSGSAAEWFGQADLLVHNSCTTAIEASLLGLPCYSFVPNFHEIYDAFLPNLLSRQFEDEDSLLDAIAEHRDEGSVEETSRRARALLSEHIGGLSGQSASETVLDVMDRTDWTCGVTRPEQLLRRGRVLASAMKRDAGEWVRGLRTPVREKQVARRNYNAQKFPETSQAEIAAALAQFGMPEAHIRAFTTDWWMVTAPGSQVAEAGSASAGDLEGTA